MVGPKFDPKNGQIMCIILFKLKRNQWRVNVNVANMLQQRIFITKIAIPISAEDSFQTLNCSLMGKILMYFRFKYIMLFRHDNKSNKSSLHYSYFKASYGTTRRQFLRYLLLIRLISSFSFQMLRFVLPQNRA